MSPKAGCLRGSMPLIYVRHDYNCIRDATYNEHTGGARSETGSIRGILNTKLHSPVQVCPQALENTARYLR